LKNFVPGSPTLPATPTPALNTSPAACPYL